MESTDSPAESSALSTDDLHAQIAVLSAAPGPYTYTVPPALAASLALGSRVIVPLGGQGRVEGVVVALLPATPTRPAPAFALRPLHSLVDGSPIPSDLLDLATFVADYYIAPLGEALRLMLPPHEQADLRHQVSLTDAGQRITRWLQAALMPVELAERTEQEKRILEVLAGRRGRAGKPALFHAAELARQVQRLGGVEHLRATLAGLETLGWLTVREDLRVGTTKKPDRWLAAGPTELSEVDRRWIDKSGLRQRVYSHILRFGPLPESELRPLGDRAVATSREILARGLLIEATTHQSAPSLPTTGASLVDSTAQGRAGRPPPVLTAEQQAALTPMLGALTGGYRGFLLHGVTGSGKTEIYLRLIAEALAQGRHAIVLVPEIALTPQLSARFVERFGDSVVVLHSALATTERAAAWRRTLKPDGGVRIVLGPRSALFAPLRNVGVIVVDEEHDGSFKQQDGVCYSGRDLALVRAQRAGAVAVLGSATPSLESLALASRGKLQRLVLRQRATGLPLPAVEVVDLRKHKLPTDKDGELLLSEPLLRSLAQTVGAGEQALLLLNRRGFATFLLCKCCGHRVECRSCSVTLTWHKARARLLCHYCGYTEPLPAACPLCGMPDVALLGTGTEKLAAQVAARFPTARVARLDRDTAGELELILSRMHRHEIDILIGTQMLAKGHDFPGVTLVGVVLADTGMGLPDFRASERTFQLLAQVAGRAGRQTRPGRVVIQTYNPEHPAVIHAVRHDYDAFAEGELAVRTTLRYPPELRLGLLRLDGRDPARVRAHAERLAALLQSEARQRGMAIELQGPAEAPLSRLMGQSRWQILVKGATSPLVRWILRRAVHESQSSVRVVADMDPTSML